MQPRTSDSHCATYGKRKLTAIYHMYHILCHKHESIFDCYYNKLSLYARHTHEQRAQLLYHSVIGHMNARLSHRLISVDWIELAVVRRCLFYLVSATIYVESFWLQSLATAYNPIKCLVELQCNKIVLHLKCVKAVWLLWMAVYDAVCRQLIRKLIRRKSVTSPTCRGQQKTHNKIDHLRVAQQIMGQPMNVCAKRVNTTNNWMANISGRHFGSLGERDWSILAFGDWMINLMASTKANDGFVVVVVAVVVIIPMAKYTTVTIRSK